MGSIVKYDASHKLCAGDLAKLAKAFEVARLNTCSGLDFDSDHLPQWWARL